MNSVNEALLAAVPMLFFPRSAEQRHLARRLAAVGVGVWPGGDPDPATLPDLVEDLAESTGARAAARSWQSRLAAVPGPRHAADLLEEWAATQDGPAPMPKPAR